MADPAATGAGRAPDPTVSAVALDHPGLAEEWGALQAAGHADTPFATWEWVGALGAVPEVSSAVRVLRVASGPTVLGLLAVERWHDDRGARVLGPAGATWLAPDHVDVLAAAADRDRVAAAVVRHLGELRGWDLLDLEGLARDGALDTALRRQRPARTVALPARVVPAPLVALHSADPRELFPSKNLRKQVTSGYRSVQRAGGRLIVRRTPAEVVAGLDVLMDLQVWRFGDASQVFAGEARRRFHREAARRLAEHDQVRLYVLEQDGGPVALLYGLLRGRRLHAYAIGSRYDVDGSPGRTLYGQMILSAAHEGITEVDLLRGDHDYKLRFATGVRQDSHLRFVRMSPRGAARAVSGAPGWAAARVRRSRHR